MKKNKGSNMFNIKSLNTTVNGNCPVHFVNIGQDIDLNDNKYSLNDIMTQDVIGNQLRYTHNIINNDFNKVAVLAKENGCSFAEEYGIHSNNVGAMRQLNYQLRDSIDSFINNGLLEFFTDIYCQMMSYYLDFIGFFDSDINKELYSEVISQSRISLYVFNKSYRLLSFESVKVRETAFLNMILLIINEYSVSIVTELLKLSKIIGIGFGLKPEEYQKFTEDSYVFINNLILVNNPNMINAVISLIERAIAVSAEYTNTEFYKCVNRLGASRYDDYDI